MLTTFFCQFFNSVPDGRDRGISCAGDQLLKITEEYELDLSGLGDKWFQENVRDVIKLKLLDTCLLSAKNYGLNLSVAQFLVPTGILTFEQQK